MSQTDDDEDAVIVKLEVKSFEWRKDLSDTEYTAYMTHVQSTSRNWVVPKRFSEFRELYGTLQAHVTQYSFPTNFTWGRLSDSALEARRLQLDEFLQLLLDFAVVELAQNLSCLQHIREFLLSILLVRLTRIVVSCRSARWRW